MPHIVAGLHAYPVGFEGRDPFGKVWCLFNSNDDVLFISSLNKFCIYKCFACAYNTFASYLDNIDDALGSSGYTNRTVISAEERNAALGLSEPPYKPGTPVVGFETTQTTQYVRVYSEGHNYPMGRWVMKYSDIQGLTAEQIKDKFALEHLPTHYCFVNIPSGIQMYTGIAAEVPGWGAGGGIQYDIVGTLGDWFSGGIPLS